MSNENTMGSVYTLRTVNNAINKINIELQQVAKVEFEVRKGKIADKLLSPIEAISQVEESISKSKLAGATVAVDSLKTVKNALTEIVKHEANPPSSTIDAGNGGSVGKALESVTALQGSSSSHRVGLSGPVTKSILIKSCSALEYVAQELAIANKKEGRNLLGTKDRRIAEKENPKNQITRNWLKADSQKTAEDIRRGNSDAPQTNKHVDEALTTIAKIQTLEEMKKSSTISTDFRKRDTSIVFETRDPALAKEILDSMPDGSGRGSVAVKLGDYTHIFQVDGATLLLDSDNPNASNKVFNDAIKSVADNNEGVIIHIFNHFIPADIILGKDHVALADMRKMDNKDSDGFMAYLVKSLKIRLEAVKDGITPPPLVIFVRDLSILNRNTCGHLKELKKSFGTANVYLIGIKDDSRTLGLDVTGLFDHSIITFSTIQVDYSKPIARIKLLDEY